MIELDLLSLGVGGTMGYMLALYRRKRQVTRAIRSEWEVKPRSERV